MPPKTLPCGHYVAMLRSGGVCIACDMERRVKGLAKSEPAKPPGLLRKAVNLVKAVGQHIAAGLPQVNDATYVLRLAACSKCELNAGTADKPKCRHPSCGCNMNVKARWSEQTCPHPDGSKWPIQLHQSGSNP